MNNVKAIIKLATGNVGFYDNLTKIHLTIASPIAKVFEGMNTTNLKNGVRCKTIEVLEGSLYDEVIIDKEPEIEEQPMTETIPPKKEEEIQVEEEKEPVVEEIVEDTPTTLEEPVVEPKKATRKRSSKKTVTKEEQSSTEESK